MEKRSFKEESEDSSQDSLIAIWNFCRFSDLKFSLQKAFKLFLFINFSFHLLIFFLS